eukprot:Skav233931  [mRNA]  locus=scaffold3074:119819:122760:+ [translate_table: standard]
MMIKYRSTALLVIVDAVQVFASYSSAASPAIAQICATALSNIIYAKKDRVFYQSKEAKEMYFLVSGALVYHMRKTINLREIPLTVKLDQSTYFCEAALWLIWRTRGEMRALAESDALLVNSKKFREASMAYPAAATLGRHLSAVDLGVAILGAFLELEP